jgi:hypothetical protein
MNKKIKEMLNSIGLCRPAEDEQEALDHTAYKAGHDLEKVQAHRDFLLALEEAEERRLESLESKTSQMISQTGIIFSLLGLFMPILMDKASAFNIWVKLLLIILLVFCSLMYLLTINNALKNYRINKYKYIRPSARNVLNLQDSDIEKFGTEQVQDLLSAINRNQDNNNKKGTNLLHAYKAFKISIGATGLLIVVFSIAALFYVPDQEEITISKPVEIKNIDNLIKQLERNGAYLDTINIKDSVYKYPVCNRSKIK